MRHVEFIGVVTGQFATETAIYCKKTVYVIDVYHLNGLLTFVNFF